MVSPDSRSLLLCSRSWIYSSQQTEMSSSSWQMWQSTALMHLVGGRPFASFLIDFAENFLSNTTMSLYLFTLLSSHIPLFSVHFLLDLVDKSVLHCAWLWYSIFVDIFHFRSEPVWDGFPLYNWGLMMQWKCSPMPSRGVGIPLSNSGLKTLCTSLMSFNWLWFSHFVSRKA